MDVADMMNRAVIHMRNGIAKIALCGGRSGGHGKCGRRAVCRIDEAGVLSAVCGVSVGGGASLPDVHIRYEAAAAKLTLTIVFGKADVGLSDAMAARFNEQKPAGMTACVRGGLVICELSENDVMPERAAERWTEWRREYISNAGVFEVMRYVATRK